MNVYDLTVRGFRPFKAPGAYTHCAKCRAYRWFDWWRGPKFGISVSTCGTCGTVPPGDVGHVRHFPALSQEKTA